MPDGRCLLSLKSLGAVIRQVLYGFTVDFIERPGVFFTEQ